MEFLSFPNLSTSLMILTKPNSTKLKMPHIFMIISEQSRCSTKIDKKSKKNSHNNQFILPNQFNIKRSGTKILFSKLKTHNKPTQSITCKILPKIMKLMIQSKSTTVLNLSSKFPSRDLSKKNISNQRTHLIL